jgi:hypothetical protein
MKYTPRQLDWWATWMIGETAYAIKKYPDAEQLRYFDEGVNNGDFSWMSSAVGYLLRAVLRVEDGKPIKGAELAVVRDLGKAAHNHLACAAVGRLAVNDSPNLFTSGLSVIYNWRTKLADHDIAPIGLNRAAADAQKGAFSVLQIIQDGGTPQAFDEQIRAMGLPVHAAFIDAAEAYGWVWPGVSSTADAVLWTP